jgi:exodeoxyribonuclease V beta subunit
MGQRYRRQPGEGRQLVFQGFRGAIDRQWRIASFTSLVTGLPHGAELPDRDAGAAVEEQPAEPLDPTTAMPALPRGAATGSCLHDILEHLDFTLADDEAQIEELIADKLQVYGLDSDWRKTVCRMVQKVLSVPLDPQKPDFQLHRIPNENRLNELEFFFPLKPLQPAKLKQLFEPHFRAEDWREFPEVLGGLHFAPLKGFMKGFMDLVFSYQKRIFLVDWKSNFLGSRLADYSSNALQTVVQRGAYVLQYLIYCVALDQYLRVRLPEYSYESHFGGVLYVFLRGVAPEEGPDYGVYRSRPSTQLIGALREALLDL